MKRITLNTLKQDRQKFEAMLGEQRQLLNEASMTILRIEGVLVYINQNITFMEKPKEVKDATPSASVNHSK